MGRKLVAQPAEITLQAYADPHPAPEVPAAALRTRQVPVQDASQITRRRFGRAISADMIEIGMRSAFRGSMRTLTDLSRETIDMDPHLGSVLNKRFSAVSSLPWEINPATGFGLDKDKAQAYASIVREQLKNLNKFREIIKQVAWALYDGRSAHELVWTPLSQEIPGRNEKVTWGVDTIHWIHPRRLNFGPARELRITDETTQVSGNFPAIGIPLDEQSLKMNRMWGKFLQWQPQSFGDYPEREGLALRCMYWSFFKRFSQRERMILLELFDKPWRVATVPEDSSASAEDLADVDNIIDGLGSTSTIRMPRGTLLDIIQPNETAGAIHKDVIDDCDKQISKLVLGQTGTTDGVPAGLNSNQASVMQDEQFALLQGDAKALSEVFETQLTDMIIEQNFGPEELPYAPNFVLRWDLPADRTTELERLDKALTSGLSIARNEAYEVSGFRQPEDGEAVIRIDQPPTPPLAPVPPPPRAVEVFPTNESPSAGEQQPIAPVASPDFGSNSADVGVAGAPDVPMFVTVNEARAGQGLPPLALEDGSIDPDGNLTIAEFKSKRVDGGRAASEQDQFSSAFEPDISRELLDVENDEELQASLALIKETVAENSRLVLSARESAGHVCCAMDHEQPETAFGSPETIIKKGERELWRAARKWADEFGDAVEGHDTAIGIFNALNEAAREDIDLRIYARPLERKMRQSTALGALDSALEIGQVNEDGEDLELTIRPDSIQLTDFSKLPFAKAMKWFRDRAVVTRAEFDKLTAALRQNAFTVAGVESIAMLNIIKDELGKQVAQGADLGKFRKFMSERLKSAGMIASKINGVFNASHIETVYRTNVLNTYNAGRFAHQSQPSVLKLRPVWEIRVIKDGRTRSTHRAVHGIKLLANDSFWKTAYPPFGFNCRCRVITRSRADISQVVSGNTIRGLPDRGFTSGIAIVGRT